MGLKLGISIVTRSVIVYWEYLKKCMLKQGSRKLNLINMQLACLLLLILHLFNPVHHGPRLS